MPGARCTRGLVCKIVRRNAHEHTGSAEAVRHSLRNGFTAYAVLSPATNSSCHRRCGFRWLSPVGSTRLRELGISNGCQDHTVLPYATSAVRPRAAESLTTEDPPCDCRLRRRCRVHRIPTRVRDDARPPLCGWDRSRILLIWVWRQVYFGKTEMAAGVREPLGEASVLPKGPRGHSRTRRTAPRAALVVSAA